MSRLPAIALALLLAGCPAPSSAQESAPTPTPQPAPAAPPSSDPADEHWAAPALPRARVLLTDAFGALHPVQVEVAHTPDSRQRGLMWRRELAPGQGMLFIFPNEVVQSFWMRNTLIPLDMLFIDDTLHVVGIVARAEPQTRSPRTVGRPSRYVLEVPGGWAEAKGIQTGSKVRFESVGAIPVN